MIKRCGPRVGPQVDCWRPGISANVMDAVTLHVKTRDGESVHPWNPDEGPLTFGRAKAVGLKINRDVLSREHGRFQVSGPELVVIDLDSRNGLKVNGQRVWKPTALKHGDVVSVGDVTIRLDLGTSAPAATIPTMELESPAAPPPSSLPDAKPVADAPPPPPSPVAPPEPEPEPEPESRVEAAPASSAEPEADPPASAEEDPFIASNVFDDLPNLRSYDQTIQAGDFPEGDTAPPPTTRRVIQLDRPRVVLGRDPKCDECLDSLLISRRNTELSSDGGRVFVQDLGSSNGTWVNGERITARAELKPGDRLAIGPFHFDFDGHRLTCEPPQQGLEVRVQALSLTDKRRGRTPANPLLNDVAFVAEPGTVVGVWGPADCGSAELLDCLAGRRPECEGSMLLNGIDLLPNLRTLRPRIGVVPPYPIAHATLRLSDALRYASRLRLSSDVPRTEIEANLQRVLESAGLAECGDQLIGRLAEDHRPRVALAMQLLDDPDLLLVDEPARGTNAGVDRALTQVLRRLAEAGKTVICVTPYLGSLEACDRVVCLMDGRVIYEGPPAEAREHLGIPEWQDVYGLAARHDAAAWRQAYLASPEGARRDQQARAASPHFVVAPKTARLPLSAKLAEDVRQSRVLTARGIRLLLRDPVRLVWAAVVPVLLGLLLGVAWGPWGGGDSAVDPAASVFAGVALGAMLLGLFVGLREVREELPIYLHERMAGLRLPAYLASKKLPLGVLALVQSGLMLAAAQVCVGFDVPTMLLQWPAVFFSAAVGTVYGLVLSALLATGRSGAAMARRPAAWAVGLFVIQAVLSGGFAPLAGWMGSLSSWAVAGYQARRGVTGPWEGVDVNTLEYWTPLLLLWAHAVAGAMVWWGLMLTKDRPAVIRRLRGRARQARPEP